MRGQSYLPYRAAITLKRLQYTFPTDYGVWSAMPLVRIFAFVACCCLLLVMAERTAMGNESDKRSEQLANLLKPLVEKHRGEVGVMVKHLPSGEVFAYREKEEMPTASLIKFPLLMAAYQKIDKEEMALEQPIEVKQEDFAPGSGILTSHFSAGLRLSLRDAMQLMIAYSDNTATNLVIDAVGLESTNKLMEELGCDATRLHAKVFRPNTSIAPERSRKFGLGSTSAADMVKLLELVHDKKFVSEERCQQILNHLYDCQEKKTIRRYLPAGTKVAHKTGAVNATRTDAGLMETPSGTIAYCVLTTANADKSWGDKNEGELLISEIGGALYRHYAGEAAPAAPAIARQLEMGSQGDLVEALQRTLNHRLKPSPELSVDGDFGPATEAAVKAFQEQAGLESTGVVDSAVWSALGPLVMSEETLPAPEQVARVNARRAERESLDGPPLVTCKGWVFIDATSGTRLAGNRADSLLNPASTTKMMTAYLVLKEAEEDPKVLDEIVTFSRRSDRTPGSTSDLREGEQISVGELLYGLMLPSGNDASVALAEHFGAKWNPEAGMSAHDKFVERMNQQAQELGMTNTSYKNPHGLTAKGHLTTPADLAQLARHAMQLPRFRQVVGTRQHLARVKSVAGYERELLWKNTNQLLERQGYLGVKTGTTDAAGACLVACGERDGREVIGVVLGSTSGDARYTDMRNLFRWVWSHPTSSIGEGVGAGKGGE
jgi:D-alanyl-D-alanine carboxypeptidase (penicillin-binding protein 5/6)